MKLGKIEITPEEFRKWPKVFPFKRVLASLFLGSLILFFLPRFVFPNAFVNLFGDKFFVLALLAGFLCGVFLIVSIISDVVKWTIHRIQYSGKYALRRINNLSPYTRSVVRAMFETDTRSRKIDILSSTWAELNKNNIVSYAEYGLKNKNELDCYLNVWVCDFLSSNVSVLNSLPEIEEYELPF